jgi:hypothetical protein
VQRSAKEQIQNSDGRDKGNVVAGVERIWNGPITRQLTVDVQIIAAKDIFDFLCTKPLATNILNSGFTVDKSSDMSRVGSL